MAQLELVGLTKHYGTTTAIDDLSLEVADRELLTLLGPSGSGKTTVLRMIAGYIAPTQGSIVVAGRAVHLLPPERRDIGMVFQSYALFPHMTVFRNVAFGLERRRTPGGDVAARVAEALSLVRLEGLEHRHPRELSGGQQQRVALARALVIRPTLLLLDEPMSSLDARLRDEVRHEIRALQRELGLTTLLVTHDQEEALSMSDRVAVIARGRLQQVGTPADIYNQPVNRFVAEFVGRMNLLPAARIERRADRATYTLASGAPLSAPSGPTDGPIETLLAVRPESLRLGTPPSSADANTLMGTLRSRSFLGELVELRIGLADGLELTLRTSGLDDLTIEPGHRVDVWWSVDQTRVLDAAGSC